MHKAFLSALLFLAPVPLHAALTDGLVAHYKFDETSGTTAADSVRGAAGDGTLTNFAAVPWVAGKIGGAVETDGANDWITTADAIETGATTMSFSGWVWADSRPVWASIAKNWGGSQVGQFHLGLNAGDGRLSNYLSNSSSVIDPEAFPLGSWQHVAFTYDGVTHRLYRNGVEVMSGNTATALNRSSGVVAFGCKTANAGTTPDGGNPGWWDGKYDEFAFWDRALTADEIASIYTAGDAGQSFTNEAPLITSFTATPPNVSAGATATLAWTVQNATTVTLSGGAWTNFDVTGQTSIITAPLNADTTFTLKATKDAQTVTADRLVGVGSAVKDPEISEFLAVNDTGLRDSLPDGDFEDWIEIHNPNASYAIDLGGYHLTDDPADLDKWTFPAVTLPAGGYLVVFASEKNLAMHANFKLSADGEYLALVKPDGATIIQQFAPVYPPQSSDVSYGDGGYLAAPTPRAANSALSGPAITLVTENPPPPADADALTISATLTPQGGATVTAATLVYRVMYTAEVSVPMTQSPGGPWTAVIPAAASTPAQMIRWRITAADSSGRTSKAPLFRVANNSPEYFGTVVQDPSVVSNLPVIHRFVQNTAAIDGDPGTRCSIFFNGEFFDNLQIRIRGNTSRNWPKKSHKIEMNSGHRFRFKAGVPRVSEFDLNTTYTDKSYVRSVLTSEMQLASGLVAPEIFPIHVRQNAAFYSVALFTENPDADMLARRGIDTSGAYYKAPNGNTYAPGTASSFEKKGPAGNSSTADITDLVSKLGLTGTALETWLFDNVDLPTMVNYIATTCITQNIDASDKNHFVYRDTLGTGEWTMLPWDLDLTFGPNALNTDTIVYNAIANNAAASHPFIGASPHLLSGGKYNRFLEAVLAPANANWQSRNMVIRRIRTLMDQFMETKWFENRIDQLVPYLDADVVKDRAKWGTNAHFGGATYTLLAATTRIKDAYLKERLKWLKTGGAVGIPESQPLAPAINFGGIEHNPANGNQDEEYIELINPNAFSVDLSGWVVAGGVSHAIKPGTVLLASSSLYLSPKPSAFRARTTGPRGGQKLFVQGNVNGHLSNFGETLTLSTPAGTQVATVTLPADPSDAQRYLVISEIMYHPEPNGDAEYVELMNISPSDTLDLTGVKFTTGIDFTFPAGFTLAPGARTLIVKNAAAFDAAYGAGKPVAGQFANLSSLNNGSDAIKLDDASGSTIREFTYDDEAPWPVAADGSGSLVLIAPLANPDHANPFNWRASMSATGNPGAEDAVHFTGNTGGDDDGDGRSNLFEYILGDSPVLTPVHTAEGLTVTITRIPNTDDAEVTGEASTGLSAWVAAELIGSTDTTLTFRVPPAMAAAERVFIRAAVKPR